MKITVKILDRDHAEILSKVLDEGIYRIGRSEFSDIVLAHETISRSHLELRVTASSVYMTNMASVGKVKLNGKPKETGEIKDGDELYAGPFRIQVFYGARDEAPAPEPPAEGAVEGEAGAAGALGVDGGLGDAAGEIGGAAADALAVVDGDGGFGENPARAETGAGAPEPERERAASSVFESSAPLKTEVEARPVVAKLIFTEGPRKGEEVFIEGYEVALGRSKKADVFIDDDKLSRVHAKISRVGMGYRLIDLNSRRGTYVNGVRVLEHPLNSFDEIQIGNTKIKFLIHDALANQFAAGQNTAMVAAGDGAAPLEQTKSILLDDVDGLGDFGDAGPSELEGPTEPPSTFRERYLNARYVREVMQDRQKMRRAGLGVIALLIVIAILIPGGKSKDVELASKDETPAQIDPKSSANLPKEFLTYSPEKQREIEGHYNSARRAAELGAYDEAVRNLAKIHDLLSYYRDSRVLLEEYQRKLKEAQVAEAQSKARKDEKEDLALYLEEGTEYLKDADFERAAESFNSAIVLDPANKDAQLGLRAAELKVRNVKDLPPERDPEEDKRTKVKELFQKAVAAFSAKSYQDAIDTAEQIRQIEIQGETQYLNEAKQIIDQSRIRQKEEFEPFLIQAKEKFAEGDYNASRDLCDEMLKRDESYDEAKECSLKAKHQLNRLAKEAYTHGYILESMNRIEEAKQYWTRAKNYVRPGDEYYDKINKKLDYYQ